MLILTHIKPGVQGYIHVYGNDILTAGLILYNLPQVFSIIIE